MKTLLVLAQHPDFAEAIRASLNQESFRVVHRTGFDEAEPLLHQGLSSAIILDAELNNVQCVWMIEKLRKRVPNCPIFVFTGAGQQEWEEEAYLSGVTQILAKPVRPRMLNAVLDRALAQISPAPRVSIPAALPPGYKAAEAAAMAAVPRGAHNVSQSLEILRNFSTILTHSLDADAMLNKFLLLLREILGVNRAAIFLREPAEAFAKPSSSGARLLRKGCAIGIPSGLLEHAELSLESGIGALLFRSGRILRRYSDEARDDAEIQGEFDLLGTQVAIPILDRETLIGVALFDGRVTGEPLLNGELELIFHLLEELGLAIKNIRLHDQLAANHEMMADMFRQLNSACVLVGQDLSILHANKAARAYFGRTARRQSDLEFSDLPQQLGGKVYQVLKTGTAITPFKFKPEDSQGVFSVSVVPFHKNGSALPASALLMAEDLTQSEQLQKLEVEAANLRLVTTMAERLAHEIGNALVPLSTHQQLLKEKQNDPEFMATLDVAMADAIKRVSRLINQMRFLARDSALSMETFSMEALIEEAYQEAQKHQSVKAPRLEYKNGHAPVIVTGDRVALKHAFSELMLNALQANPSDPKIGVDVHSDSNGNGHQDVRIEIQDNGTGFSSEVGQKASAPFYTTRNVGLGLGLTVSRKIIETHHGKLEIVDSKDRQAGIVRITLPLSPSGGN